MYMYGVYRYKLSLMARLIVEGFKKVFCFVKVQNAICSGCRNEKIPLKSLVNLVIKTPTRIME